MSTMAQGIQPLILKSKSFKQNDILSLVHAYTTCGGQNHSPELEWDFVPEGTRSLALIVHDPDVPNGHFVHWVIFNIPPTVTHLPSSIPKVERLDNGALQGTNNFGALGYDGPCPPSGAHHYIFTLYALDRMLPLQAGASEEEVLNESKNHILETATLTGRYKAFHTY